MPPSGPGNTWFWVWILLCWLEQRGLCLHWEIFINPPHLSRKKRKVGEMMPLAVFWNEERK